MDRIPGPVSVLNPAFPNELAGGSTNALGFQNEPVVLDPVLGSPTWLGRIEEPIFARSPVVVIVAGRPLCSRMMLLVCQPPRTYDSGPDFRYVWPSPSGMT